MTSRTSFNTFAINGYDEDRAMPLVQPITRSSFHTVDCQSNNDKFFFQGSGNELTWIADIHKIAMVRYMACFQCSECIFYTP